MIKLIQHKTNIFIFTSAAKALCNNKKKHQQTVMGFQYVLVLVYAEIIFFTS